VQYYTPFAQLLTTCTSSTTTTREKTRWASSSSLISYCVLLHHLRISISLVRKPASFLFSLLLEIRAIFSFYSCMGPEIIMYQMVAGGLVFVFFANGLESAGLFIPISDLKMEK
jgi:hypothetical protein